jgi:asparagine synthase (glutamine-hydrolysing)
MCGIAGIIGREASAEAAQAMSARIAHRGPDGAGIWEAAGVVLAHRRLAILDPTVAGAQPMQFGAHVLTYNGELYNFHALRATIDASLHSNCDTEVLLHLLARDGKRCLPKLVGMFAFAVWDEERRQLFAARDRLGIKPLYYRVLADGIAFASELKALLVLGTPPIDKSAVRDFLFHGYIPAPKTIYQGIAKLAAGHSLSFRDGDLRIERYWEPSLEIHLRDREASLGQLDALLRIVVPEHTLSDVPVGVFLSGGMDSALTAYYLGGPRTFTLGFDADERSEADAARAVAAHLGARHTAMSADSADLDAALNTITRLFDEPFGDSAAWSNYLIAGCARRDVTVALSGEGGDEIFCGYPRYWSAIGARSTSLNRALAAWLPPLSRFGQSMQRHALTGLPGFSAALGALTGVQVDTLLHPAWLESDYDYDWFYRQFWRESLDPLAQLRWLDINTNLPEGLLVKVDRTSMAHSLEVRPPLLDHRLVEFMLGVDPQLLVDQDARRGKLLVRELMQPRLPPGHLERPKSGFGLPLHRWIRRHPQMWQDAVRRLLDRGVLRQPVSSDFRRAWSLLVLDRWFSAFG